MTKITVCETLMSVVAMGFFVMAYPATASAQSVDDLVQMCAGCHGEKGVPMDKAIPVIWGQNRSYILNQLHDFKTGRRKNEQMSPIVKSLSWSDMTALATHFSKLGWPDLGQPAPSAETESQAKDPEFHQLQGLPPRRLPGRYREASPCRAAGRVSFEADA